MTLYICDDIEDGVKKGYIPWLSEYQKLKDKFSSDPKYGVIFNGLENTSINKKMEEKEQIMAHVRFFRNAVQGYLIRSAAQCFMDDYRQIMNGEYELNDLLGRDKGLVEELKKITNNYCFVCDEVLTLEIIGNRVIRELLDTFYKAIITSNYKIIEDPSKYEGKIYRMISDNYKYIAKFDYKTNECRDLKDISEYDKIHLIVDFVSGMTDSYAVLLYKKLLGIDLPE